MVTFLPSKHQSEVELLSQLNICNNSFGSLHLSVVEQSVQWMIQGQSF